MAYLITIDGLDGSGKETQARLLTESLQKEGYNVRTLSFPMYGTPGAQGVELYLHGGLGGKPEDTNAYAASMLFGYDRYLSYRTDWAEDCRRDDTVIVFNRYTTANAVHQLSKLPRAEWDAFLAWLWDFEFTKLGLPMPDRILYLEMTPAISHRLIDGRTAETGRQKDIHETDAHHLENSYAAALYAAEKLAWTRIRCYEGDEPRPIADIHAEIREKIFPYLPRLHK